MHRDHTGKEIKIGQRVLIDGGHTDDMYGKIVIDGVWLAVKYDHNGDTVRLNKDLCDNLEILN